MERFLTKLGDCLCTVWGWLAGVALFLAEFFGGYALALHSIMVFVLLDLGWGIAVAVKCKKYTLSESARNTVTKVVSYYSSILIIILLEKMIGVDTPWGVTLVSVIIGLTELWSISGNMLIINPNIPFLKIIRPALIGEIARKLGRSEDEIKEILDSGGKLTDASNQKQGAGA